jgi:hypothetical protein
MSKIKLRQHNRIIFRRFKNEQKRFETLVIKDFTGKRDEYYDKKSN